MADLGRFAQKIFGSIGGTTEFGKIGSDAAGSPATTKDLAEIQSLVQYDGGLFDITADGAEPPRIQDINALYYLITAQLAYLFQKGMPEWIATEEYYAGKSFAQYGSKIYLALNDNVNSIPSPSSGDWRLLGTVAAIENELILRGNGGRSKIGAPVEDDDIANRGWVRDFVYPVGSYYVQYPNAASNTDATEFPTAQRPATLFGGTWAEQWATESVYFRTRGTLSDDGRWNTNDGSNPSRVGRQEDAGQRITGSSSDAVVGGGGTTGTVYGSEAIRLGPPDSSGWTNTGSSRVLRTLTFDSSLSSAKTNDNETRVVNRRIKVWKRTA